MNQPTKDALREQLALAADRIIEQGYEIELWQEAGRCVMDGMKEILEEVEKRRWWHRFAWWRK